MGNESRRRNKISRKRKRNRPAVAAKPTSVHDLTDDLLELVFLGLDSPLCLTRTASTCKRWRRIVASAGGAFLRRFRSIHEPPALGHFYYTAVGVGPPCSFGQSHPFPSQNPIFVPSSAASAAVAAAPHGRHLSLGFVPPSTSGLRELVDSRGSLLLLLEVEDKDGPAVHDFSWYYDDDNRMIPHLVVCEPLTRRYLELPPLKPVCIVGAFLLDAVVAGGAIGMDSFRVLVVVYQPDNDDNDRYSYSHGSPYASVFTSGKDGGWDHGDDDWDGVYLPRLDEIHLAGRTGGRIYWGCEDKQERTWLFSVDLETMELEREHERNRYSGMAYPCRLPWPPLLRACVDD